MMFILYMFSNLESNCIWYGTVSSNLGGKKIYLVNANASRVVRVKISETYIDIPAY